MQTIESKIKTLSKAQMSYRQGGFQFYSKVCALQTPPTLEQPIPYYVEKQNTDVMSCLVIKLGYGINLRHSNQKHPETLHSSRCD